MPEIHYWKYIAVDAAVRECPERVDSGGFRLRLSERVPAELNSHDKQPQ
jgi:hypothetical protein